MQATVAFSSQDILGEGPLWSPDEQALYWVDIQRPALQRWHPASGDYRYWQMPTEIGSFALREAGGSVVALRSGLHFFDFARGRLDPICDPESEQPFTRFNDGKVDRQGCFWAGTMDEGFAEHRRAALYRLDPGGQCSRRRAGVGISNGLGWSPDNRVMYYTDSAEHAIYAFDFDPVAGQIAKERLFARTPAAYVPDGLTVDAAGYVWSAKWDGWKVVRYSPDGRVDLEIPLPVQRPTSCTFGGPTMQQLYITSARDGLSPAELAGQPLAGSLFVVETGVRGLVEPKFVG
jgi:sugar lactone lactonase YvrE